MCDIIVINRGEKEIETSRQFKDHFGFMPDKQDICEEAMDCCLCNCDIDQAFTENNIAYKYIAGEYYVGQLHELE